MSVLDDSVKCVYLLHVLHVWAMLTASLSYISLHVLLSIVVTVF